MIICWDNLETLKYSKTGKWYKINNSGNYIYYKHIDKCKNCDEPFLSLINKKGNFCSNKCCTSYKRDEKYRKNISDSKKDVYKGKNNPNFNNKWTENQKKKSSKIMKGKGLGRKRPNHSIRMMGEGNPNWKDGLSYEPYCELWKDKKYKYHIKERDKNKCNNPLCENKTNKLCIHHIDYNKKNCSPSNLITICFSCNAKANYSRDFWEKHYKKIMENKMSINENTMKIRMEVK